MKRDLDALAGRRFDVLVIGGGIYGACIARDAAMRGLSVALIEKSDFCSATSHNSLKIIHSGIRYLQHLDFKRVRESIVERRTWLSIAPHLVRPLRFVIPTQGYLTRGPLALQAAIFLHRLLGADWNRGVPNESKIRMGRVYGRAGLRRSIPGLPLDGLSGAASWHDGQVVDADRVVIECLQSAVENGGVVANYVEADSLMQTNGRVHGVLARDRAGHRELEINARMTVNAGGPWVQEILKRSLGNEAGSAMPPLAKNMNIVTRQLLPDHGVGIPSKRTSDAVIGSESRLFFITPWRDVSAIGTTHFPYEGNPDDYRVTEKEIDDFLDEINESWPPAELTKEDVLYVYSGLTPAEPETAHGEVGRLKHAEIVDHGVRNGYEGLVSVIGVKYTTSRLVAERAVTLVQAKLGIEGSPMGSRTTRLPGAADAAAEGEQTARAGRHDDETADLLDRYGNRLPGELTAGADSYAEVFAACARHAVRSEMALNLDDFLLRRNDLAARGKLTASLVRLAADEMGRMLNWSAAESENRQNRMRAALRYLPDARQDGGADCKIDRNHGIRA